MNVTLYSTGCPKCNVLEKKLQIAGIDFNIEGAETMIEKGFESAPILDVDGEYMTFMEALKWIDTRQE